MSVGYLKMQDTMNVGAVGSLRHCKEAVVTARRVLEHTTHSLLVGLQASQFAMEMNVPLDNLTTEKSHAIWKRWQAALVLTNPVWLGVCRKEAAQPAVKICWGLAGGRAAASQTSGEAWFRMLRSIAGPTSQQM